MTDQNDQQVCAVCVFQGAAKILGSWVDLPSATEATPAGVCPDCGTDWYEVLEHDETMQRENIDYCPQCGTELNENGAE